MPIIIGSAILPEDTANWPIPIAKKTASKLPSPRLNPRLNVVPEEKKFKTIEYTAEEHVSILFYNYFLSSIIVVQFVAWLMKCPRVNYN